MKQIIFTWLLSVAFITAASAQYGTERTGYEGDFFSLEGAVELFKESFSIRDFERKLNSEGSWVNNLDLDYDGRTDYVRVEHRRQGNFHAIVLQVHVDRYDVQDIAVIEIEKIRRRRAVLQIVGDEDLYGDEVIVEPFDNDYYGSSSRYRNNDYVNVYYWPAVQSMFDRHYTVYVSPYSWHYQPTWWNPWNQHSWHVYRPYRVRHRRHCHVVSIHRVIHVHNFYKPHRVYSHHVVKHTNMVRVKHGKPPIDRPRVDGHSNKTYKGSRRSSDRPGNTRQAQGDRNNKKVYTRSSSSGVNKQSSRVDKQPRNKKYDSPKRKVEVDRRSKEMDNARRNKPTSRPSSKANKPSKSFGNRDKKSSSTKKSKPQKRDYGQERRAEPKKKTYKKPSSSAKRSAPKVKKAPKVKRSQSPRPSAKKQKASPSRNKQASRNKAPSPRKMSKDKRGK